VQVVGVVLELIDEVEVLLAADLAPHLLDLHRSGLSQFDAQLVLKQFGKNFFANRFTSNCVKVKLDVK
jgi:hypothetical protein